MFGFINVYKPKGITSHDVVSRLRKITKIKQIGHTGTLDPLAEGVLPVAIGKASRLIEYLEEDKAYIAELKLGIISDTYDCEGEMKQYSNKKISIEELIGGLNKFVGAIEQIPPAYSAVHYNGKRLYELAREGNIPDDIPKRTVVVSKCKLLSFDEEKQFAKIEIECSKGTYIRSIIHDLGMNLETGAVMMGLIRTKSGKFELKTSIHLDKIMDNQVVLDYLINPADVINLKQLKITEAEIEKIKHGQAIVTDNFDENEKVVVIFDSKICAIGEKKGKNLITKKVFVQ
jgi:tRNA pseudouridine55 synthase